ncbi:MAG: recombination protein RecR [Oscillospiraceae bacterium]|nr:recombination protein RecR [Oscillospiraceae bacterium]
MKYDLVPFTRLVEHFERLPGIGKKSAQRLAFHILGLPDETVNDFADSLVDAKKKIRYCKICKNLTDGEICEICSDGSRDDSTVCVVENAKDALSIERSGEYKGKYHVLHGLISPMDGIGPDSLYIKDLVLRAGNGNIKEVIMATNPTVEGEATALYIAKLLKPLGIKVTRLAYGIPVGGHLEYADNITLYRAIEGRSEI